MQQPSNNEDVNTCLFCVISYTDHGRHRGYSGIVRWRQIRLNRLLNGFRFPDLEAIQLGVRMEFRAPTGNGFGHIGVQVIEDMVMAILIISLYEQFAGLSCLLIRSLTRVPVIRDRSYCDGHV